MDGGGSLGRRDIIMIGTSAGGVEPLKRLVADLPADLPAALFVILHLPPWHRSELPSVLSYSGRLPASHPVSGQLVRPGHIYIAPPDYHMLLDEENKIQLWRGPKENRHRPSINASFRSAAVNYRERVIGVVLSGMLDDGATGLWWIKHYGGLAIVQDPRETQFPDMPCAAMEHVDVDYVTAAAKIGALVNELSQEEESISQTKPIVKDS
jgi:two-component system, chemotaxis family, protein-glutamate methylesterase/glutaminase